MRTKHNCDMFVIPGHIKPWHLSKVILPLATYRFAFCRKVYPLCKYRSRRLDTYAQFLFASVLRTEAYRLYDSCYPPIITYRLQDTQVAIHPFLLALFTFRQSSPFMNILLYMQGFEPVLFLVSGISDNLLIRLGLTVCLTLLLTLGFASGTK